MRRPCLFILFLAFASPSWADEASLKEARKRWLKGNYEEARELYETLAKEDKTRDAARIGLSRVAQSQGEYDKAQEIIETALKDSPKNADLQARLAEAHYLRGRWPEAEKAAETALEISKEHFLARWVRAQIYRDRGDLKKADAEFRWFVRTYTSRSNADKDIKDPDELLIVGQAGCENARWNNLSDQFQFILTDVYGDALKNDPDFWPAENEAGTLLIEKYNRGEALDAFDKALKINPKAAEALVGKGVTALQKFDIKDAEQFAEQALKINPHLLEALNLRADVHLASGDVAKALGELDQARKINPRDEAVLGRVAACLHLQRKREELDKLVKEVEEHDPKPGMFYYYLAEQLDDRRRYDDAEAYYKKAAELRPMLPWAKNSLGLLYMRMGKEKEARAILEKAFEADGFNVRVSNTLKVLRHLDKYETLKTEHFELRFDPKTDKILAKYMGKYLEDIYATLAEKFAHRPKGPILVEVFNSHDKFSGRTIALPDLHTIGACTGRMVAMVSPRCPDIGKPFNWARVIRHELVHIFNLDQTNFLVPHWYTEGLAVMQEGFPRPQEWNELLAERVPANQLMDLTSIDLGFLRPRNPLDWHMAYCQSQLYVQFMTEKFGPRTVGELLNAYREGLDTPAAITKVCKVEKEDFEKGYREFLDKVVKGLGKKVAKKITYQELQEAYEKDQDNLDLAAQVAEQYFLRGRKGDARKLVDSILVRKKGHPLASYVKARLLQAAGDDDKALELLEESLDPKAPEPRVLQVLGKLSFEAGNFTKAAEMYELARKTEPFESKWLVELARVYTQTGDKEKTIAILKELVPMDADDLDQRKKLARLLLDAGKHAEAETYARQALEIDVLDPQIHKILGESLLAQKKADQAVDALTLALELDDTADDIRVKLAQAYLEAGQKQKAENVVTKILARDPDNAEAQKLKKLLEK